VKSKCAEFCLPHGNFIVTVFPTVYALREALPETSENVAVHGTLTSGEICAAFFRIQQKRLGEGQFGEMWIARSTTLSHVIHESVHVADCYLSIRESMGAPSTFDVVTEKRAVLVGVIMRLALKEKRA
jgi:hypothetical protein